MSLPHSPYHALLLLSDEKSLLGELPLDCSPALVRVIKTTSAVKNLQQLAQDADLALLQVPLGAWGDTLGGQDGQSEGGAGRVTGGTSSCLPRAVVQSRAAAWPATVMDLESDRPLGWGPEFLPRVCVMVGVLVCGREE